MTKRKIYKYRELYDLKIDKSIFKIFYNNYDINLLKYQVVNQISIKYKSQISPNSNFVVDDLVQFSKKKFKKNSLFLFYYGLKQFFKYFTLIFVKAKKNNFELGNNLDLLITNSDHFKKLSKSHLSSINKNFIIFNYDNPFVINLGSENFRNITFFNYLLFLPKYLLILTTLILKTNVFNISDYLILKMLIHNIIKIFFMENLHKKIKSNVGRLFSTNISNFDFLIFKNNILDDNIFTIGFTHGIIEDPFYYNSNIDNIYVNTNFDKKLMDEFSDIKNVKNLNIYGIKHLNYNKTSKNILIVLTAGEGIYSEEIISFLNLCKTFLKNLDYNSVTLRPHPNSSIDNLKPDILQIFDDKKVTIEKNNKLKFQLENSFFCISMFSSIVFNIAEYDFPIKIYLNKNLCDIGSISQIPELFILDGIKTYEFNIDDYKSRKLIM